MHGLSSEEGAATTDEDTPVDVDVLANDAAALTVTRILAPDHGTAAVNPEGTLRYTPEADYHGAEDGRYFLGRRKRPTKIPGGITRGNEKAPFRFRLFGLAIESHSFLDPGRAFFSE